MDLAYVLAPFTAWFASGTIKFLCNAWRFGAAEAWSRRGYGGIPSTHTATVTAPVVLIWLREGWRSPALSVALAVALIVIFDAMALRKEIGKHAAALNSISPGRDLRERIGHTPVEVGCGILVGAACAWGLFACG